MKARNLFKKFTSFAIVGSILLSNGITTVFSDDETSNEPQEEDVVALLDSETGEDQSIPEEISVEETVNDDNSIAETVDDSAVEDETIEEETVPSNEVGSDVTTFEEVTPEEITVETVTMPAFHSEAVTDNGVVVVVDANEGNFPEGTSLCVKDVLKETAMDIASEAKSEEDVEIVDAIGVDITFIHNNEEIQPATADGVYVSISLAETDIADADNYSVVHEGEEQAEVITEDADNTGASFTAESFSIYVISAENQPALATYHFFVDGTEVSTQIVKTGDTLYSPETTANDTQLLKGWSTSAASTDIAKAPFKDEVVTVTETADINLYAVYDYVYYVFFKDYTENGDRVIATKSGFSTDTITVDDVIVPLDSTHSVTGWYYDAALTNQVTDNTVTIDNANITLYPKVEEGHTIYFDTLGGTYIEPQFLRANGNTVAPANPTRSGYTFNGWKDSSGNAYTFGGQLTDNITLTADWTANNNTQYTVIYWKQSVNDSKTASEDQKTYDYEKSVVRTATTGSIVSGANDQTYANFHFNKADENVTVKGDGSTIVNVYYDRNLLTINFVSFEYTPTNSDSGTQYGLVNGNYVALWKNIFGNWRYDDGSVWGASYNEQRYTRSEKVEEMTGLYGQTLAQNGYVWPSEYKWSSSPNNENNVLTFLDAFIFDNLTEANADKTSITEYNRGNNSGSRTVNHYKQNIDGSYSSTPTNSTPATANRFSFTNKYHGFTVAQYSTDNRRWTTINLSEGTNTSVRTFTTLHVHYTRNSYTLEFNSGNEIVNSVQILFEDSLSGYASFTPNRPAGLSDEFTFGGWYKDQEFTQEFDFNTTMPANNIVVYAKWIAPEYDVDIHLTVTGDDTPIKSKVTYGGQISESDLPTVKDSNGNVIVQGDDANVMTIPANYTWYGWTTKTADNLYVKYDFNAKVYSDLTLYPYYVNTAKYNVTYSLGDGTGTAPTDNQNYATGTHADVLAFPSNANAPTDKVFLYWTDGSNNYYPDDKVEIQSADITLTAVYGDQSANTSLIYQSGYDANTSTVSDIPNNGAVTLVTPESLGFTRTGYQFVGWKSATDNAIYQPGTEVHVDTTNEDAHNVLIAQWKKIVTVNIIGVTETKTYNGADQTVTDFTYEIVEGDEYKSGVNVVYADDATTTVTRKDVGTSSYQYVESDFVITSDDYIVNIGTIGELSLTITKRPITFTSATAEKEYDGNALTDSNVTIGGDGLAGSDTVAFNVTGTQTLPGNSKNTFTYEFDSNVDVNNYEITKTEGTLTVKDRTTKYEITVKANSSNTKYDGDEKTVSGFETLTFTFDGHDYTVEGLSAEAHGTDAGSYISAVNGTAVVKDAQGNNVTSQFTVNKVNGSLEIAKRTLTFTSATAEKEYDGTSLTNGDITVGGDGFVKNENATYDVTGTQTLVGSSANTFTYTLINGAKESNYEITKTEGTLTVKDRTNKYEIELVANSDTQKYNGSEQSVSGFGATTFTVNGNNFTVSGLTSLASGTDAGTYPTNITGTAVVKDVNGNDVTDQFTVTTKPGSLTITKRNVTLASASDSKEYDGSALTNGNVTVGGDGFASGEGATYDVTGSQTLVGSSANTFTYALNSNTKADNYNITTSEGTLNVTNRNAKYEITVVAQSAEEKYDGTQKSVSGFETLTFTVDGNTYTVEGLVATTSGTDAGTYPNTIAGTAIVKDASGNDVSDQFKVNMTNGKLVINPRNITFTSATDEKQYDGSALANDNVSVTEDGFVGTDGVTFNVTGSQTLVGSSKNTFTYAWNTNTNPSNYVVKTNEGTLTVKDRTDKYAITVQSKSDTQTYNAIEYSVSGFETLTFTFDGHDYTVEGLSAEAKGTNAGSYTSAVTGTAIVRDASNNDVTAQFTVTTTDGTLNINKRPITFTSATDEKEYDGTPLTNSNVTVGGLGYATGESATFTVTGTQTLPGNSKNTFTYEFDSNVDVNNYEITKTEGTLTVKDRTTKYEITVKANSGNDKYDGTEKTVSGFETLTFNVNGVAYIVSGLSSEAKGTDAGSYTTSITGTAIVKDTNGNDVTDQFTVNTEVGTLTIAKRDVTLTSATDEKQYDGNPLTNGNVTVGGDGFASGEGATYDVTGTQTLVGSSANTFTYVLNNNTKADNYNITTSNGTLTVINRDAQYDITVAANSNTETYDGTEKKAEGFATLTFTVDGNSYTVSGLEAKVTGTDAGEYTNTITGTPVVKDANGNDVSDQFAVHTKDGKLTINPRNITLTSGSSEKEYDGSALTNSTVTVGGDGFAAGEGATYDVTGSQTLVGSSNNTFTYTLNDGTKSSNYTITPVEGKLTVTDRTNKYEITVTANSDEFTYDSTEKTVSGFETLNFTVEGNTYSVEGLNASASRTNAGSSTVVITGNAVVKDASNNDVTAQFTVTTIDGTLKINKRPITFTSATDEKEYDGTPLTNTNVTIGGQNLAGNDKVDFTVTGAQTLVGESANGFTYTFTNGALADNYEVTKTEGTLKVTDRINPYVITVKANSGNDKYDGTEKTVSGFETLTFNVNGVAYIVSGLSSEAKGTDAGSYTTSITGTAIVKDTNGNDVTNQFTVNTEVGTLTIAKRDVTLTSATDEKQYDGNPLTNGNVTVGGDGFASGEGATYDVTGTQTLVGSSANTFTYVLNSNTKADNYNITTSNGTLTVINRDALFEITAEANSSEVKYDGAEKSVEGFKTSTFVVDGNTYTLSGLDAKAVGTNAGQYQTTITGTPVVKDASGNDVSSQFAVKTENGTLTVTKREITLTSATDSKEYDGTPLTNATITVSGDDFATGEGATYNVSGTQTIPGNTANVFTYTLNANTNANNYVIITTPGTLTVTDRTTPLDITVVANSGEETYDGTQKSISGLEETQFVVNDKTFTVNGLDASATGTDANTYASVITGTASVIDENGNDVTAQFNVIQKDGSLVIHKREYSVETYSAEKEYDGTALTASGAITGIADGDSGNVVLTTIGSQLDPGESDNAYIINWNSVNANNYVLANESIGTLKVDKNTTQFVITADSDAKVYDGTALEKPTYTTNITSTSLPAGHILEVEVSGSITNVGTVPNVVSARILREKQVSFFTTFAAFFTSDTSDLYEDVTDNFNLNLVDGVLEITAKKVVVSVDSTQKTIGDADPSFNTTVTGLLGDDTVSFNVSRIAGESVGIYPIQVTGEEVQGNYIVEYVPGTLTIVGRPPVPNTDDNSGSNDNNQNMRPVVPDTSDHTNTSAWVMFTTSIATLFGALWMVMRNRKKNRA